MLAAAEQRRKEIEAFQAELRRHGIGKEAAMEGDARSTTHPIQQPIKTEAEANSAFDDITYQKGEAFLRMLENFLGEDGFRDGIRRYINAHQYSNSTTADLWSALSEACRHPLDLGAVVKRGAQPGAGTSLAGLDNSRCDSLIGCYGISGRPFIASNNFCERCS